MSKLCILEPGGDFLSESIFRKVYDFHKIGRKEIHFLEIFFVLRSKNFDFSSAFLSFPVSCSGA